MRVTSKSGYLDLYAPKKGYIVHRKSRSKDRRNGRDRRNLSPAKYFLKGGIERRRWRERRYLWYQTM